jgi:hypothetical protein
MRTTLDIDDEVLQAAKEIARRQQSTAGAVLSELARSALTGHRYVSETVAEAPAFYGFRPLPAAGRVVTDEVVKKLRDEEGV